MGSHQKQQYNDAAEEERLDQIECIDARKMKLIMKLAALRTSLTCSDNSSDQPLRLSQCSILQQDLRRFDRMYWQPGFSCSAALSLVPDGGFQIMAPNASSIAVLEAISILQLTRTRPTWINNIVWNRDSYAGSVFKITDHPIGQYATINYYVLSHASQQPVWATFAAIDIHHLDSPLIIAQEGSQHHLLRNWEFIWRVSFDASRFVSTDSWPFTDQSTIHMITGVKIYDYGIIAGDGPWMDQALMLASFPIAGKDESEPSEPEQKFFVDEELDQLPWELQLDHTPPVLPLIKKSRTMNYSSRHDHPATFRQLTDTQMTADELSEIFLDLEHTRRSMARWVGFFNEMTRQE